MNRRFSFDVPLAFMDIISEAADNAKMTPREYLKEGVRVFLRNTQANVLEARRRKTEQNIEVAFIDHGIVQ